MKKSFLAIAAVIALTNSVFALGTDAGTDISNQATLSYSAGGVAQPTVDSNTDTFKVDKKVDMVLSTTDSDQIEVTPGQQDRITNYTFKNEGNSNEYFKFEVANLANDKEADYNDKKDSDDVNNLEIKCVYTDENGDTQTADWASSFIIKVKEDTNATCQVRADINNPDSTPGTNDAGAGDDGDIMNVELKATAYKDDKSAPEEETTGADTQNSVDVVFADGESVQNGASSGLGETAADDNSTKGDTAGDGIDVARSGYIIKTPVLSVQKTSCPISDPVNNTTNPKRIPGAVIRYMFDIQNTGTGDVSDLNISDTLNDNFDLTNTQSSAKKDEDKDSCSCDSEPSTDISGDTTVSGQDVKITKVNVASGKHSCISIEAEIK